MMKLFDYRDVPAERVEQGGEGCQDSVADDKGLGG